MDLTRITGDAKSTCWRNVVAMLGQDITVKLGSKLQKMEGSTDCQVEAERSNVRSRIFT